MAWGRNQSGQCNVPAPNAGFVAVAGGNSHSLGLKADGTIVAWGDNSYGQCNVPTPNAGFVAVAGGGYHSLGLKSGGIIAAWGYNQYGQCNVPAPNAGFVAVAGGASHSLGLKATGSIVAWGNPNNGQCSVPAPNANFVAVAAGEVHSLGLKSDGSIVTWGYDLGNVPAPNADFVAIAGGEFHSLGLKSDGSIVAWGSNGAGQCNVPAPNAGFIAVAAGYQHSLGVGPPAPVGACCLSNGTCTITTAEACTAPGIWQGAGTDCEPNPCLQCQVTMIAPNGGESWPVGSQQAITWNRTDNCDDVVRIELLRRTPGPSSRSDIYRACATIAVAAPNTGSYAWMVERCGIGADQYKVQITDVAAGASDRSDGPFSIPGEQQLATLPLGREIVTLPLPFRPGSPIRFESRESGPVRVTICDVLGRRIRTLVDGPLGAGDQRVRWDARTDGGEKAPSGIYYLGIKLGDRQMNSKIFLIR